MVVTSNLKPSAQCAKVAKMAQVVLGQISCAFHYRDWHVFIRLYKQYVRPHLEFSTQAWAPWLEQDKAILEKVHKRAVGMVSGLQERDYEGRLRELDLESLEERRHQADMLMTYKIIHGNGGLDLSTWFAVAGDSVRATRATADSLNVRPKLGQLEVRRNFISVRASVHWNVVPANIKRAHNAGCFKNEYKRHRAGLMQVAVH